MNSKYRVLALDGGGSWALIQVKTLMRLFDAGENTTGWEVLGAFDLVAANSGGSIVLGCLMENMTLAQILAFFMSEDERRTVFSKTDKIGDEALEAILGFGPKYSAEKKLPALEKVLTARGRLPLPKAAEGIQGASGGDVHVLIVGFDYDRERARFFRSAATGSTAYGTGAAAAVTLADAIHASSNAPVDYFDAAAQFPDNPGRYWDGAITGANNPVLVGVTEAMTTTDAGTEIVALSLGTGTVALPWSQEGEEESPYVRQPSKTGLKNDLEKLSEAILDDPPDMASYLAYVMTSNGAGSGGVVRMNPMISPVRDAEGRWTAPGDLTESDFTTISNIGMDAIAQDEVNAIARYAELWLSHRAPNQPVRMDGDSLGCEIGQATFSAAKAAWEAMR